MARNFKFAEVVGVIVENNDQVLVAELAKRYPYLTSQVLRVVATSTDGGAAFSELVKFMPDYLTALRVNSPMKKQYEGSADEDDTDVSDIDAEEDEEEDEVPKEVKKAPKKKPAKAAEEFTPDDETDYASLTSAKLYKILGEMGKRKECKEKFGDLSKASMVEYLTKFGAGTNTSDESDAEPSKYEGKTAVELYKECKARKIKAEQKKPAKYYVELLEKADAATAKVEAEADEDDEDWGEEEEAPKPVKRGRPAKEAKKPAKKPAKPEPEEDEDDDADDDDEWEI